MNRPPAGEWQRALRGLLADGRLNERYPGPVPASRIGARAVSGVPGRHGGARVLRVPGFAGSAGAAGGVAGAGGRGVPGARPAGTMRLISPGFAQRVGAAAAPAFGRPAARAGAQAQARGRCGSGGRSWWRGSSPARPCCCSCSRGCSLRRFQCHRVGTAGPARTSVPVLRARTSTRRTRGRARSCRSIPGTTRVPDSARGVPAIAVAAFSDRGRDVF